MTQTYHDPINSEAMADAATFNAPLGQLDAMLNTLATSTDALDTRIDLLVLAGSNVSTLTNGAANASQKVVVVDSTSGFLAGAPVAYTLVGGVIETNTVGTVDSPTQLTLGTNIGTGGIANDTYLAVIPLGSLMATGAVVGATGSAQAFTAGVRVGAGWSADDTAVNVKRTLSGIINSHAYRDESALTPGAGTTGYAPYDSRYTLAGATSYDHFASFQNRPTFSGSGTITKHVGFWSLPEHSGAGTITSLYHNWVWNVQGGGTVTNQYGLYVNELTGGATNYAIFTAGSTPSFLNGNVRLGSELRVDGLAAFGNVAANSAYQLYVSSNLNATKIAAQAVIAVAPINVSTGTTYGAFYSIAALNNTLSAIETNFTFGLTSRAALQATAANSAVRYAYAAHVQASASANAGYTVTALGMYGLLVDSFSATGAGTITIGGTAGVVINNQGTPKATVSYGVKIENQTGSASSYAIYTDTGEVRLGDVVNFAGTMGDSTKDPTSDAPADWVQIKIGASTYYLPAYAAS